MVGRRRMKCGKCDNCLSGRWERKCLRPLEGQVSNVKVCDDNSTLPKRECAVKASTQFPKTGSLPKGNNTKGYWARIPSLKPKPARENKRKLQESKDGDTLVIKTTINKSTMKRQMIGTFDFFGISQASAHSFQKG